MSTTPAEQGQIVTDLGALYRAGRQEFPAQAAEVSAVAGHLRGAIDEINGRAAQFGDPQVMVDALAATDLVYDALARMVETLNDCAVGLIHIADDFVGRDEDARSAFDTLGDRLKNGPPPQQAEVPQHNGDPTQEGAGDDYVSTPDPESQESDLDTRNDQLEDATPAFPGGTP